MQIIVKDLWNQHFYRQWRCVLKSGPVSCLNLYANMDLIDTKPFRLAGFEARAFYPFAKPPKRRATTPRFQM